AEAGCALAGGHTVQNPEPLYGLSVTGLVNPHRVISNAGAQAGDHLLLTKPIGTGIISTAIKKGLASDELIEKVSAHMASLNTCGTAMAEAGLTRAGTDVTGFGLLGHLSHLCRESGVTARLDASMVPAFDPAVIDFIKSGCVPGGSRKNLELAREFTRFGNDVPAELQILLADAQTSGGLLLAVSPEHYQEAQDLLFAKGAAVVADIGVVTHQEDIAVIVS
ncbi:selenide, water dikinase SelD, partial [Akkermansiaceae bacterium]|nr:selenide, water dikinase SelD [Akkermansiaceae bacterium]